MKGLTRNALALLIAITCWGCMVRVWNLGSQSLWIDEGYTINAALSVQEKGVPKLDSGAWYTNGPLSVYASALTMKLFSFDPFSPWSARIPAAVAGTILIPLAFFLARRLFFSENAAFAAAFFMAFLQWEVVWSQQARGYTLLSCWVFAAFIFLDRYFEKRKPIELVFALVALCGAYLSHSIAIIFFLPFLLALIYRAKGKEGIFSGAVLFAGGIVTVAIGALVLPLETTAFRSFYATHAPAFLIAISLPALAGFIVGLFDHARKARIIELGLMTWIPFLSVLALSPVSQFRYFLPVFPFLALLAAYGVSRIAELLGRSVIIRAGITVCGVAALWPFLTFVPGHAGKLELGSPQPDFGAAFKIMRRDMKDGDIVVSPYAQFHKIYLGQKGAWLMMSLAQREDELERKTVSGRDFYVGAPIVKDVSALERLAAQDHGFIVMDSLAEGRLKEVRDYINSSKRFSLIFESGSYQDSSHISLFRF